MNLIKKERPTQKKRKRRRRKIIRRPFVGKKKLWEDHKNFNSIYALNAKRFSKNVFVKTTRKTKLFIYVLWGSLEERAKKKFVRFVRWWNHQLKFYGETTCVREQKNERKTEQTSKRELMLKEFRLLRLLGSIMREIGRNFWSVLFYFLWF